MVGRVINYTKCFFWSDSVLQFVICARFCISIYLAFTKAPDAFLCSYARQLVAVLDRILCLHRKYDGLRWRIRKMLSKWRTSVSNK